MAGEDMRDLAIPSSRYTWNDAGEYNGKTICTVDKMGKVDRQDVRHGEGTARWPDGSYYEGNFEMGLR